MVSAAALSRVNYANFLDNRKEALARDWFARVLKGLQAVVVELVYTADLKSAAD